MVREPVVEGQFYPQDKDNLRELIAGFDPKKSAKVSAKGAILPHAGYIYSGKVAVNTVGSLLPKKRVIVLGTNHTGYGAQFSLWGRGAWKTPLADIRIDEECAKKILACDSYIEEDYLAHKFEHSIEVELPILYYFFGDFKFVPISCKVSKLDDYRKAASQIACAVKKIRDEVLIVASTDMTHYEPEPRARKQDRVALESIVSLDEEDLVKKVNRHNITMCGIAPVAVFIACVKQLGAKKAQVSLYETSAQTSGDSTSVVGYAGIIVN